MQDEELKHYGILGMKWGKRKANKKSYKSTGIRAAIARKQNEKIDKSFEKWKENNEKKNNAIELGKKANTAKLAYEHNKSDKNLKTAYKTANKDYKKALKDNTTYRKGQIRREVGSDISRKYLSEAKKIKKQLNSDSNNKGLQKKYNNLMSKHDVERAKARKATDVAARRSQYKANVKRAMTVTVKAAVGTAAVIGGAHVVNSYLNKHDVKLNGKPVKIGAQTLSNVADLARKGKDLLKYLY